MLKLVSFLMLVVGIGSGEFIETYYEEELSFAQKPQCKPSNLNRGIACDKIGSAIEVQGGLYADYDLHYIPLASAYYVARFADALGYTGCLTNLTFLAELDIQTPWSGVHGAIAIDGSCGYKRLIRRQCVFPSPPYPFLCTGSPGTPGTYGSRLETLSYISILQGGDNRWTLFAHCWRAKTPQDPNAQALATSFNVFSLDRTLTNDDKNLIIDELKKRGFNTSPSNIIEFDYSSQNCTQT